MSGLRSVLTALVLAALTVAAGGPAWADEMDDLREKVDRLEKDQAELYHSLEEKKSPGLMKEIFERVSFGGLVEVEASVDSNDNDSNDGLASDVVLATVELGLDAEISERVSGHVLLLWEEDDTDPIDMDEGTITIAVTDELSVTGGKMYIPFGAFNSHFVSDPITLELGETNESGIMATYARGFVEGSLGVFNGHNDETGSDDVIEDWYAAVTAAPVEGVTGGVYYTSDLGDSEVMTDDVIGGTSVNETAAGFGAFVSIAHGPVIFDAEYITATDRFGADVDANSNGLGDKPSAWNVEVALEANERLEVAVKAEGGRDFFEQPEFQYGVAASYGIFANTAVAVEFLHGEYDNEDVTRDLGTVQVAVEF